MEKDDTEGLCLQQLPDDVLATVFSICVLDQGATTLARVNRQFHTILKTVKRIHEPTLEIERKYTRLVEEERNLRQLLAQKRHHVGQQRPAMPPLLGWSILVWECCEQVGDYGAAPAQPNSALNDGKMSEYGCILEPGCKLDEWNQILYLADAKKEAISSDSSRVCTQCGAPGHTYLHCQALSCVNCDAFWNRCWEDGRCPALMCTKCKIWGHKTQNCVTVVCNFCKETFVRGHDVDDCALRAQENSCDFCASKGHWRQACHLLPCKACNSNDHLTEGCRNRHAVKAYRLKLREERARQDQERKAQVLREREERAAAKTSRNNFWTAVMSGSVAQVAPFFEKKSTEEITPSFCEMALNIAKEKGFIELAFYLAVRIAMQREKITIENIDATQKRVFDLLRPSSSLESPATETHDLIDLSSSSSSIQSDSSVSSIAVAPEDIIPTGSTSSTEATQHTLDAVPTKPSKGKGARIVAPKPKKIKPTGSKPGLDKLWPAAHSGSVPKISKFLDSGISVDCCNNAGKTMLMIAAEKGHIELIRFLLDRGADLLIANNAGLRAVDFASSIEIQNLLQPPALAAPADNVESV